MKTRHKTAVISIGNELLSGRVLNTNLLYIGRGLNKLGIKIDFAPVIGDNIKMFDEMLSYSLTNYDIVITTGGLGPTDDDITKKAAAGFFNQRLITDTEILCSLQKRFGCKNAHLQACPEEQPQKEKRTPLKPHRHLALAAERPEHFKVLKNDAGISPGLYFNTPAISHRKTDDKLIVLLPGVPLEIKHLFQQKTVPLLRKHCRFKPSAATTIHTIDLCELALADAIDGVNLPAGIELSFSTFPGRVDLTITGSSDENIQQAYQQVKEKLERHIWGIDEESISHKAHDLLIEKGLTLSVAESCTGGLVQQMLTAIPGASHCFKGGVVAYSNETKTKILHIDNFMLEKYGAVSLETAAKMAENVKVLFGSDIGLAISGIAGPGGGNKEKPVGTVCMAVSANDRTNVYRKHFKGSRDTVREKAANYMLFLLLKYLRL